MIDSYNVVTREKMHTIVKSIVIYCLSEQSM